MTVALGTTIFVLLTILGADYLFALFADYAGGALFSYYMNKRFTFGAEMKSDVVPLAMTVVNYAIVFLLNAVLLFVAVETLNQDPIAAQLIILVGLAAFNFIVFKYLIFGGAAGTAPRVENGSDLKMEMLRDEYTYMAEAEQEMWWYCAVHEYFLRAIKRRFGEDRSIRILDAGCGTGGFLNFLRQHGYENCKGIDVSSTAISFCQARGLDVVYGSIDDSSDMEQHGDFDLIVSLDVICSLPDHESRLRFFSLAYSRLKPGGQILVQTPAFEAMRGIHDLAVRVNHRYTCSEMRELLARYELEPRSLRYRLFMLSIPITVVRTLQRWKLANSNDVSIRSDVDVPPHWLNSALLGWQRLEDRFLPFKPFGSSLIIELGKE